MSEAVNAQSVSYAVGRSTLVDTVTLRVSAGELVGIVGPNGAGKSTLLALLAGDIRTTAGIVTQAGMPIEELDHGTLARMRSVLPQQRVADIPFTVREVVAMGRHPWRAEMGNSAAADAAAVQRAIDRTATETLAERAYATLSGGEQARVSIARVLAQDAPLMLLDEPTAALDVAHEERIMGELRRLSERGVAVIAVLHDLNTAARFASRIVAMADGRIRAEGSPRQVLTDALLTEIYDHPMRVVAHPFRDAPLVLVDD